MIYLCFRTSEVDPTDVRHDASYMGYRPTVSTRFPEAVAMRYRVLNIGKGSTNDVDLERFGHCNFLAPKHAVIFYDEVSEQIWFQGFVTKNTVLLVFQTLRTHQLLFTRYICQQHILLQRQPVAPPSKRSRRGRSHQRNRLRPRPRLPGKSGARNDRQKEESMQDEKEPLWSENDSFRWCRKVRVLLQHGRRKDRLGGIRHLESWCPAQIRVCIFRIFDCGMCWVICWWRLLWMDLCLDCFRSCDNVFEKFVFH